MHPYRFRLFITALHCVNSNRKIRFPREFFHSQYACFVAFNREPKWHNIFSIVQVTDNVILISFPRTGRMLLVYKETEVLYCIICTLSIPEFQRF